MSPATIQWEDVRRRLRETEDRLNLPESPERITAIFRQRAAQLAKTQTEKMPAGENIPALVFRLANERYAIALKDLAEVVPFRGCTEVPGSSPLFLGVINLRGELRPVLDLAQVLCGVPSTGSGAVLVLRDRIALKVDEAEDLRLLDEGELTQPVQGQHTRILASENLAMLDVGTMLSAVLSQKESQSL